MIIRNATIVITGATRGIGKATSERLIEEGGRLVFLCRTNQQAATLLDLYGNSHIYYQCDLNSAVEINKTIQSVQKSEISINGLLNIAGLGIYKPLESVQFEEWTQSFAISVTAPFLLAQGLLPQLSKSPESIVLNIGSGAGTSPIKGRSTYCAVKYALRGWTLSLAEEFQNRSPSFSLITLGSTLTDFGGTSAEAKRTEQSRGKAFYTPESVAEKIIEIINDEKREPEVLLYPHW